jgi:hypothetical protein
MAERLIKGEFEGQLVYAHGQECLSAFIGWAKNARKFAENAGYPLRAEFWIASDVANSVKKKCCVMCEFDRQSSNDRIRLFKQYDK